ncbi:MULTISPECIES: hypothetical protein [Aeromonas]|nr:MULTISPECIES: hypothetical protein [Aeromonas]MBS4700668.1 hypothetical protein [Aeromonas media]MDM5060121.1 hypothetical protein [Aeromonas rivipollensis]NEX82393.1 hypothetical protein [Aeromonas rivipollensis]QIY87490.1 hypothetical protein HFP99_12995 [Aeromonas hydrophila]
MQALFIFSAAQAPGMSCQKQRPYCALLPVFLANLPYQIKKFILDMG